MTVIETGTRFFGRQVVDVLRKIRLVQRRAGIGRIVDGMRPRPVRVERQPFGEAPFDAERERVIGRPAVPADVVDLAQLRNRPARRDRPGPGSGTLRTVELSACTVREPM